MAMAAWRSIDAVCQVNQFMRNRDLNGLRLHIWLNKDEVAMADLMGWQYLAKTRERSHC